MTKLRAMLAGSALAGFTAVAHADFSYVSAVASDSDFRGSSQSANSAAVSLALDYITMPSGGFKQSGTGRDKSLHAFDKYTELKTTWIDLA